MKRWFPSMALVTAAVCLCIPLFGLRTYSKILEVRTCEPSLNVLTSGGYAFGPGWAPGYYPPYPYYWMSVYNTWYYEPPVTTTNPQLGIDYTNLSDKIMKQIEFGLVANGNLIAEVRDVGKFSPGVEIKHKFGISHNVFPIGTGLPQCVPLRITFEDGTVWTSPHLRELRDKLERY